MNLHHKIGALLIGASTIAMCSTAMAQDAPVDEVVAVGIRQSLNNALLEKRESASLIEVILAEDIGKLPDQNIAEVLENVTGIQIVREAGVGTGVQIRGTDDNRLEINGVTTLGAGNGRTGINFEDISPAILSGLEVIKAPVAGTIEGAVGGTINLRTIRPLELDGTLASIKFQLEDSSLSDDGLQPRVQGAFGQKWEDGTGKGFGFVVAGSYTNSDNTEFRPRLDRDNATICTGDTPPPSCPEGADAFLGVQFLNQVQINQEFETLNLSGSVEARPTNDLRLFADVIFNQQERRQESSRAQFSNVSRLNGGSDVTNAASINFTDFETIDLGSIEGANGSQDLGSIQVVTAGTFSPLGPEFSEELTGDPDLDGRGAPFLRASSDTGARLT